MAGSNAIADAPTGSSWQQSLNAWARPNAWRPGSTTPMVQAMRRYPLPVTRRPFLFTPTPAAYRKLSRFTLERQGLALKLLNFWMGTQSFVAAILHGGYEFKGLPLRGKMIEGLYEPARYSGLWPGIYKPGAAVRKWAIDTPLLTSCLWDSGNAFLKYTAHTQSLGAGVAAGAAELANGLCFNVKFSEPIIYGVMNKTMRFLARVTKSSIFHNLDDFVAKPTPELIKKGIPLSYRVTRTLLAGAVALASIEAIMAINSKWVTPFMAKKLGPVMDKAFRKSGVCCPVADKPVAINHFPLQKPVVQPRSPILPNMPKPNPQNTQRTSGSIPQTVPHVLPPVIDSGVGAKSVAMKSSITA